MLIERSKAKQGIDEKRVTSLATKGGRKAFRLDTKRLTRSAAKIATAVSFGSPPAQLGPTSEASACPIGRRVSCWYTMDLVNPTRRRRGGLFEAPDRSRLRSDQTT